MMKGYKPGSIDVPVTLIRPKKAPGDHFSMLQVPNNDTLAQHIKSTLGGAHPTTDDKS